MQNELIDPDKLKAHQNLLKELAPRMVGIRQREGQYSYRRDDGSIATESYNLEKDMCQQQFAKECDINEVVKAYVRTGELPVHKKTGYFMDVSSAQDYKNSLLTISAADDAFMSMDAKIRNKFGNDPAAMLEWMQNDDNYKEAIELGLVDKHEPSVQEKMLSIMQRQEDAAKSAQGEKPQE